MGGEQPPNEQLPKKQGEIICWVIIAIGFVLRILYIYYTGDYERQHDVGNFTEENNFYHSGYINYIIENHRLPDSDPRDCWQFYHPPLYHTVSALILIFVQSLGIDYKEAAPDILQFMACLYSTSFCIVANRTMMLLGIRDKALAFATAAVVFHPTLIIMSGSMNNDMLSSLLGMAAVYFTVRWAGSRKISDILGIAVTLGFGMVTKLTVGLLAPAIAAVFLTVLIKNRKEWLRLSGQFLLFGAVCVPVGLAWTVRNYVRFGVAPNYVPALSEDSGQYIDMLPIKRLTDFSLYQFSSPFTQWEWNGAEYNEFNPIIALLKNAMFDEETFFPGNAAMQSLCIVLFIAGAAFAIISAAAIVFISVKDVKLPFEYKLLLTVISAVIFGNYIIFCLNYPQVCTQNMRYCVPLIFTLAAASGLLIQRFERRGGAVGAFVFAAEYSCSVMCCLSAFIYTALLVLK